MKTAFDVAAGSASRCEFAFGERRPIGMGERS